MNWRALGEAVRSPGRLAETVRKAGPVLYAEFVRPVLPRTGDVVEYNGVAVEEVRRLDGVVPASLTRYVTTSGDDDYEDVLVDQLRRHVEAGDEVAVVGGGLGVSSVAAARATGPDGHVDVYEGSEPHVGRVARTLRLNGVDDRSTVHHAIVSEAKDLRAHPGDADVLAPDALPDCDVLELDCEGAELAILREIDATPRVVVVETHAGLGSPKDEVVEVLRSRGYAVVDEVTLSEADGLDVVTAHREG
jgi:hypothetical protein